MDDHSAIVYHVLVHHRPTAYARTQIYM
jgi:hypothetical protein